MFVLDRAVQTVHRFRRTESHEGARRGNANAIVVVREQRQHRHVGLLHAHLAEQGNGVAHHEPAAVAHQFE